jgi:hypothetical protein
VRRQQPPDLAQVEQLQLLGALERAAQMVRGDVRGEIQQSPRDGRHGDPGSGRGLDLQGPVDLQADGLLAAGGARNGDLGGAAIRPQAPERGRTPMAENGGGPGDEDGSHPAGLRRR